MLDPNPRFSLEIAALTHDLQVLSFTGTESISQPYEFTVELVSRKVPLDIESLLHKAAYLAFDLEGNGIHGRIARIALRDAGKYLTRYSLKLVPSLAYLKHRTNQRIFQHQTVPQIITTILKEHFILTDTHRFIMRDEGPVREYCVQSESDLHFIQRLCQEEGIHYHFEHSRKNHQLVFANYLTEFTKLEHPTRYEQDSGMVAEEPTINRFEVRLETRPNRTTRRNHAFLLSTTAMESNFKDYQLNPQPDLEDYSYPDRFDDRSRGNTLARHAYERHRADYRQAEGDSNQPTLLSGHFMCMENHPCEDWNNLWLLTEVRHTGKQPQVLEEHFCEQPGDQGDASEQGYRNTFLAKFWDVPYRPPLHYPKPRMMGSQTAVVTGPAGEEIYCDAHGRVKARFRWDRQTQPDEHSSCWLRVAASWAGQAHGSVTVPRIGMEVLVSFLDGDPDQPIISGCLVNLVNRAPYPLPAHKTRSVFRSRSSPDNGGFNELQVEDRAGHELIFIQAERDIEQQIGHDSRLEVGNDRRETVKGMSISVLGAEEHRTVSADRKTRLNANDYLYVAGNSHCQVEQDIIVGAGQRVRIQAGAHIELEAAASVTLKAGGHHFIIDHSGITASTEVTLGGAPAPGAQLSIPLPDGNDALVAPVLLAALPVAPTQAALMAASQEAGDDFCPLCQACRDGVCPTESAVL